MDKRYIERKLEVMKTVYEQNRELAAGLAGPAVMEIFGETPFSPAVKASAPAYSEAQRSLALLYDSRSGQLTNEYIKGMNAVLRSSHIPFLKLVRIMQRFSMK